MDGRRRWKMRVYGNKDGNIGLYELKTLRDMQKFVGGWIESFRMTNGLMIVCDDEALLKGKPVTVIVSINNVPVEIRGNYFYCSIKNNDFCSLSDNDLKKLGVKYD